MEDFELHRVTKKLEDIEAEYIQLNHQILNTRRTEQFEEEMLARRFDGILNRLESRRTELEKEKRNYQRQLERIELRLLDKEKQAVQDKEELERARRTGRK